MSETRFDWLADRWVIFAPHRSQRPDEFRGQVQEPNPSLRCPFCAGNELDTPETVLQLPRPTRGARRPPWQVRVIPNKYPALMPLENRSPNIVYSEPSIDEFDDPQRIVAVQSVGHTYAARGRSDFLSNLETYPRSDSVHAVASADVLEHDPIFSSRPLNGAHEVIIESPKHLLSITELDESQTRMVFEAFQKRLVYWRAHDSLRYAVVFKNVGSDAGASLTHTHSQLIATTFVPPDVVRSCLRLADFRERFGSPYFASMITKEISARSRVVAETRRLVAIAPFASQIPYFVLVLPKRQEARFEETDHETIEELSSLVRKILSAMENLFPNAAYNFVMHTSPFDPCWDNVFHWRMELFPRLTKVAGFEWGSDCFINPVLPEIAASVLKKQVEALGAY